MSILFLLLLRNYRNWEEEEEDKFPLPPFLLSPTHFPPKNRGTLVEKNKRSLSFRLGK